MKVILAGVTGFIGGEVLNRCIQHPAVTSIVALTRRLLSSPVSENAKVEVVLVEDYLSYSPSVLEAIRGADVCIWSLGKAWMADLDMARKVNVDYPMAAARAMNDQMTTADGKTRQFRFVYLSGGLAERDQAKSLWFSQDYRHIRGQAENELIDYLEKNPDTFEPYIIRPAFVLAMEPPPTITLRGIIRSLGPSIRVDNLAKVMLKIALEGHTQNTLGNPAILQVASEA